MTRLFPNKLEPLWAPYNRQQFGALGKLCEVEVLSTVPWFPGARFLPKSMAGRLVGVPDEDCIADSCACATLGICARRASVTGSRACCTRRRWRRSCSASDCGSTCSLLRGRRHAVAAVMLGRALGIPVAVKIHGPDFLNVLAKTTSIGMNLRWALPRADCVLAVSRPLMQVAIALGGVRGPSTRPCSWTASTGSCSTYATGVRSDVRLGSPKRERSRSSSATFSRRRALRILVTAFEALAPRRRDLHLVDHRSGPDEGGARGARADDWRAAQDPRTAAARGGRSLPRRCRLIDAAEPTRARRACASLASGRPVVMTAVGGIPDIVDRALFGELLPARDPRTRSQPRSIA